MQSLEDKVDPIDMEAYTDIIQGTVVACYLRNALLLEPLAACESAQLRDVAKAYTHLAQAQTSQDPNLLKLAPSGGRFALLATTMVFPLPPSLAKLDTNSDQACMAQEQDPSPRHNYTGEYQNPATPQSETSTFGSVLGGLFG